MSGKFRDLADGGTRLAELIDADLAATAVLVSIGEGGAVTGAAVAVALGVDVRALTTTRRDDGVNVDLGGLEVTDRVVVVLDDGVETGTAAMAAATVLRRAGAGSVVLAVPVCPREVEPLLRSRFDEVIAVTRPLARRSLRWHYESFA